MSTTAIPVAEPLASGVWSVPSRSRPGEDHTVWQHGADFFCSCEAFKFGRRPCRHVRAAWVEAGHCGECGEQLVTVQRWRRGCYVLVDECVSWWTIEGRVVMCHELPAGQARPVRAA